MMVATAGLCLAVGFWFFPEELFHSIWSILAGWAVIFATSETVWKIQFGWGPTKGTRSYIVDLLLPMPVQADVQANLEELMPLWIAAHGERKALRIRRIQVFYVVAGYYGSLAIDNLGKIVGIVIGR